ncbi:hypothetical protein ABKZ05_003442 [Vibrio navarrensis]
MSSGTSIPYHLRQNKAVERILFEEQLKILDRWLIDVNANSIEKYRYVGFGGPFLEDFKSIHRNLKIVDMVSIELDEDTLKRQEFNKPVSCITLLNRPMKAEEFINNDPFSKETILWLDYVSTEYNSQLDDVRNAIEKMSEYDILKVTLNANAGNIQTSNPNLQQGRLEVFEEKISNDYLPMHLQADDFTNKNFHKVLINSVVNALSAGTSNKPDLKAKLLSSFVYKDGQQMLTISCILLSDLKAKHFDQNSKLKDWEFYYDGQHVHDISLPSLSARERIEIERLLPDGDLQAVKQRLGYKIVRGQNENDLLLENFIHYHARYPWFGKIAI